MKRIWKWIVIAYVYFLKILECLKPLGDLAARFWVAKIFFHAGWLKVTSWSSTMMLFSNEFRVPLLSPYWAALLGTTAELVLPVLLVLGLGGRFSIFVFFMYNLIAVISYPFLWTADGGQALAQHINWGLLLALLMFHGSGRWSLDYWIRAKVGHRFAFPHK